MVILFFCKKLYVLNTQFVGWAIIGEPSDQIDFTFIFHLETV